MNAKLNKRRAAALLAHYATCERLALALADDINLAAPNQQRNGFILRSSVDGKKISVALWKIERRASKANEDLCSIPNCQDQTDAEIALCKKLIGDLFGKLPPGFFCNRDPRGCALKIDPDNAEGRALIESCRLHTDLGGYGCLSPEITGD